MKNKIVILFVLMTSAFFVSCGNSASETKEVQTEQTTKMEVKDTTKIEVKDTTKKTEPEAEHGHSHGDGDKKHSH